MKKLRAVAYCRVSTAMERQQFSLENQRMFYEHYINSRPDCIFSGLYVDIASGTSRKKRTQFNKMVQDCRKGKIDIIFTKSVNRFARNTVDFLTVIRDLKARGIDVYFENERILLSNERSELVMTFFAAHMQAESESRSNSIKWSLKAGFKDGSSKLANRICYGYTHDENGNLVISSSEAETVRLIFQFYLDGHSLSGIVKELHTRGILSPTGKESWTPAAVDKLLSNEKYTGNVLLQKTYVPNVLKQIQVRNEELDKYLYEGNHIGIIDGETFSAVQEEKKRRSNKTVNEEGKSQRKSTRYTSGSSLSGKIQCGECGRNYRRITTHSGEIVWRCASRVEGNKNCGSRTVKQREIDELLREQFGDGMPLKDMYRKIDKILITDKKVQLKYQEGVFMI